MRYIAAVMRRSDLAKLTAPYPTDGTLRKTVEETLGIHAPNWALVEQAVFGDLTPHAPWGIAWWDPAPGTSRRILIADQLYCCTHSVNQNLVEAAIHWLEYQDWVERESDRNANVLKFVNKQPEIKMKPPANALEELGDRLIALHAVGVARALSGVLDCMAGTIIGVTGIPLSILKADLDGVRRYLAEIAGQMGPHLEGRAAQIEFGRTLEAAIVAAGPADWLKWLLALRNTYIHRGRRLEVGQFVPRTPIIRDWLGRVIPRVDSVMHLPLDPERSDVEVLVDPARTPVLTEAATETFKGLMASTAKLVDDVAKEVLAFWNWRKAVPSRILQPKQQWPAGRSTRVHAFDGYRVGSLPYDPAMLVGHPRTLERIRAAALEDSVRAGWTTFD